MQNFNFIEKLVSGVNKDTGKKYTLSDIVCALCVGVVLLFAAVLFIACLVFVCVTENNLGI